MSEKRGAQREGVKKPGSCGWVQIKPSSGGLNLSRVCFRAGVAEGQALCSGVLEVLSNIQTPCLQSPVHTQTET